jgi:hypothetical protein
MTSVAHCSRLIRLKRNNRFDFAGRSQGSPSVACAAVGLGAGSTEDLVCESHKMQYMFCGTPLFPCPSSLVLVPYCSQRLCHIYHIPDM